MLKGQAQGPKPPLEFERLVSPHVASFDYFLNEGMKEAVQLLDPLEVGHHAPSMHTQQLRWMFSMYC